MNQITVQDVVIGNSWAALGALANLTRAGHQVIWFTGTGSHLLAPLPAVESGAAAEAWRDLTGVQGEVLAGSFLREYKNKSFREPEWTRDADSIEQLWEGERAWVNLQECRFENLSLLEIEDTLRAELSTNPLVVKKENLLWQKISPSAEGWSLEWSENYTVECKNVWMADRSSILNEVDGIHRPVLFFRGRSSHAVLQVVFTHTQANEFGLNEGIFAPITRDAGDSVQRHVWGHFFDLGRKSVWSVVVTPEEAEDSHEVAKKLRKMKQSLDKIFPDFLKRVESEQVRFEEGAVFAQGKKPEKPTALPGMKGVYLLTDGYGPSCAMIQATFCGVVGSVSQAHAETKSVDAASLVLQHN